MQPFEFDGDWSGQLIATSIHAGHELRPEVAEMMALDEDVRFREEDPYTDRIGALAPARVVVHRSRFEADLNRPRPEAVYRTPDDAWGLELWTEGELPDDIVAGSLEVYDHVYEALAERLDEVASRGPFVLLDIHSYNHRRPGPEEPHEPVEENPEINLGTGTVDGRFSGVIDAFSRTMLEQGFDVRENVKFKGRNLAWWVHERYPRLGCVLALEFKKTFMDEWTGQPDEPRIEHLARTLAATFDPIREALDR
ncbi:MAG TPA: N-formylglutamate amidohydrolase [Actinomycetota bacterium]